MKNIFKLYAFSLLLGALVSLPTVGIAVPNPTDACPMAADTYPTREAALKALGISEEQAQKLKKESLDGLVDLVSVNNLIYFLKNTPENEAKVRVETWVKLNPRTGQRNDYSNIVEPHLRYYNKETGSTEYIALSELQTRMKMEPRTWCITDHVYTAKGFEQFVSDKDRLRKAKEVGVTEALFAGNPSFYRTFEQNFIRKYMTAFGHKIKWKGDELRFFKGGEQDPIDWNRLGLQFDDKGLITNYSYTYQGFVPGARGEELRIWRKLSADAGAKDPNFYPESYRGNYVLEVVRTTNDDAWFPAHVWVRLINDKGEVISVGFHPVGSEGAYWGSVPGRVESPDKFEAIKFDQRDRMVITAFKLDKEQYDNVYGKIHEYQTESLDGEHEYSMTYGIATNKTDPQGQVIKNSNNLPITIENCVAFVNMVLKAANLNVPLFEVAETAWALGPGYLPLPGKTGGAFVTITQNIPNWQQWIASSRSATAPFALPEAAKPQQVAETLVSIGPTDYTVVGWTTPTNSTPTTPVEPPLSTEIPRLVEPPPSTEISPIAETPPAGVARNSWLEALSDLGSWAVNLFTVEPASSPGEEAKVVPYRTREVTRALPDPTEPDAASLERERVIVIVRDRCYPALMLDELIQKMNDPSLRQFKEEMITYAMRQEPSRNIVQEKQRYREGKGASPYRRNKEVLKQLEGHKEAVMTQVMSVLYDLKEANLGRGADPWRPKKSLNPDLLTTTEGMGILLGAAHYAASESCDPEIRAGLGFLIDEINGYLASMQTLGWIKMAPSAEEEATESANPAGDDAE